MRGSTVTLRRRRLRAGLTQRDLGALVGITKAAISLIERGRRRPRPATLARLLEVLRR